ncbi:MAG: 2-oxoglutarate dehydrogenase, E2 component, dihydrolipoamide succinyltransferase [Terracidiphilus sp.]
MPTDVIMPQMGESIFEGTISKWLKATGETVEKDEPLFEISTDKVDAEIPSPVSGVLSEIRFPEGATVQVNTVVAVIGDGGGATATAGKEPAREAAGAAPAPAAAPTQGPPPPKSAAAPGAEEATAAAAPSTPAPAAGTPEPGGRQGRYSPLVRRMAKEHNLDLDRIEGSGLEGRVTKDDVLRALSQQEAGGGQPAASAPSAAKPSARPAQQTEPAPAAMPGELAPMSKMRAIIAQRMAESAQIAPHVHTVFKVDMTRVVRLREREKAKFEQRNGVKLTYMPFIAVAAVEALRKFPIVNASMENTSVRYHPNINLGIAVALEWGLIVPVIAQAEERNFLGLARAVADLAERARGKKLKPEEISGSTFTLTNSGIFGEEFGMPIINQPDSAILAIGGLRKEPVVVTDAQGNDSIAIRSVQYFCLGFDHRIIDGAGAWKFMSEFKKTLENWSGDIG